MKQEQTHKNWIQIKHEQEKMHNPNYPLSKKKLPKIQKLEKRLKRIQTESKTRISPRKIQPWKILALPRRKSGLQHRKMIKRRWWNGIRRHTLSSNRWCRVEERSCKHTHSLFFFSSGKVQKLRFPRFVWRIKPSTL